MFSHSSGCCRSDARQGQSDVAIETGLHPAHDPRSTQYINPRYWGVSYEDVRSFKRDVIAYRKQGRFDDVKGDDDDPTIYTVNTNYIKPLTREKGGMSWALMKHEKGLLCDSFATHAWMEGALEFVRKVKKGWPMRSKGIYICFLANPQNGNLDKLLGDDIRESPFYLALQGCRYMIVVSNSKQSIYARLWCVFEANEAINMAKHGQLQIIIPWNPRRRWICGFFCLSLMTVLLGYGLGFCVMHESIGGLLGPVMWILVAFMISYAGSWSLHTLVNYLLRSSRITHRCAVTTMVVFEYIDLTILGIASGISFRWIVPNNHHWTTSLFHYLFYFEDFNSTASSTHGTIVYDLEHSAMKEFFQDKSDLVYERGEGVTCLQILFSLCFIYFYKIVLVLIRYIIKINSDDLDQNFESVRFAEATNKRDSAKIKEHINGREDEIDTTIKQLVRIGRCNRDVLYNLSLGMGLDTISDGIHPFKIMCGSFAWLFWYDTDMAGTRHDVKATVVPMACTVCILLVAYGYFGDRSVFAIDAYVWFGMLFVLVSNHPLIFTKASVLDHKMRTSSMPVFWVCLALMLLANIYHYCGIRARFNAGMSKLGFRTDESLGVGSSPGYAALPNTENAKVEKTP